MEQGVGVVGIDLGTTNSAVAVLRGGQAALIPLDGEPLLPSVVGFDSGGQVLIGHAARNQYMLYPERTVRSIKRRMGEDAEVELGETSLSPVEISALILRRLKVAAERHLGGPVHRAVITVPAYFNDAQRTATREAGEVAGFEVLRVLNEPTAAALCYLHEHEETHRTFLVYDLGGGTFDVSIVRVRGQVTEVLASHGDTQLGGDDFDAALCEQLRQRFVAAHGVDPMGPDGTAQARARLLRAAEEAKIRLSSRASTQVIEEHLLTVDGVGKHLNVELTRAAYEGWIEPWLQRTRDSVQVALREAKVLASELDDVILVGGATRTPRVQAMLEELLGRAPRQDVDPDQAVALGAALQAARLGGDVSQRILVDITPFSFGTSALGILNGERSPHVYSPVIRRSTALPTRQSREFSTLCDGQERVDVKIYHGEEEDARQNTLLGRFMVEDLDPDAEEGSPIRFDMMLNLDGILKVDVVEVHTGKTKSVTIHEAFRKLSKEGLIKARHRMLSLLGESGQDWDFAHSVATSEVLEASPGVAEAAAEVEVPELPGDLLLDERPIWVQAQGQLRAALALVASGRLSSGDQEEVEELLEALRGAMASEETDEVAETSKVLSDVLFYLQG